MARIALKVALSRLRKLFGKDRVVEVREGKLFLNRQLIWLDVWALEIAAERTSQLLERGYPPKTEEVEEVSSLVFRLYQGEFLKGDNETWVTPHRDKFKNRFLKTIHMIGELLRDDAGGAWKEPYLYELAVERGVLLKEFEKHKTLLTLVTSKGVEKAKFLTAK